MKSILIICTTLLFSVSVSTQDIKCFLSGPNINTVTISALSACGKYFSGTVNGATNYTDVYSCVSGNSRVGGESIFYFDDVIEGTYTFKIDGFATDLDLFILSSCDESTCLTNAGARRSSGRSESVTVDLANGQNVYIVVDGKFVSSAVFTLEISCDGGICDKLTPISCGYIAHENNYISGRHATNVINSHSGCGGGSYPLPEVAYYLNTYKSSPITIDLVPESRVDLDLFVYDDCHGSLSNCLGASNRSPWGESIYLSSGGNGGNVIIVVDGKTQSGHFDLAVTCGEPCDNRPTKIGCNTVINSTTRRKSNNASYYGCDPYNNKGQNWGPEEVFEINLDDTYDMDITLKIKGKHDLNLYLLGRKCDPYSCIEGSKSDNPGQPERIKKRLRKGKYYIVVEGYRGDAADYTLSVSGCGCIIEDALECGKPIKGTLNNGKNSVTSINGDCFIKEVQLPNEDLTYSFIAKEDGYYSFVLSGMKRGMDLFVTRDCNDPNACVGSSTLSGTDTDIVNVEMMKDEQVLILVDGLVNYANSDFNLEVICADKVPDEPNDDDHDNGEDDDDNGDDDNEPTEIDVPVLLCGENYSGTTLEKPSIYRKGDYTCFISSLDFRGGEELVRIEKENDNDVLVLHMFHGEKSLENLSMFIMDSTMSEVNNCKGLNFKVDKSIGNGKVIGEYFTDGDNLLPAGTYYAVLDGYNSRVASDFTLTSTCSALDCEAIVGLPCGESFIAEFTDSSFNGESIYRSDTEVFVGYTGGENIYSFCLDSAMSIDVTIYGIQEIEGYSGDLDMFLMENVCSKDKKVIAHSRNKGTVDENIKVNLNAGEYYIVIDGWNGSRATFSFRNDTCYAATCGKRKKAATIKDKTDFGSVLTISPNPFTDLMNLFYKPLNGSTFTLSLFDSTGKIIASQKRRSGKSEISTLFPSDQKGIFYIQIIDGNIVKSKKIVRL
ncbi:MAG: T9SS type A sorting domain-containing protein [Saprospiraceae bacterium]